MPTCEVCGATLKDPKSKSHVNTKRHQNALAEKGIIQPIKVPESRSASEYHIIQKFEKRIFLVEDQVKFIMKKLDSIDLRLADSNHSVLSNQANISLVKSHLRSIPSGVSKSIDEIAQLKELKDYNWNIIQKAILDLIDDEIFDVSEGRSRKKLPGDIGRLIRR